MPGQRPYDFVYVHTDIPEAMTIREWRARCSTVRAAERQAAREAGRQHSVRRRLYATTRTWLTALWPQRAPAHRISAPLWQPRNRRTAGEGVRVVLGHVRQP
jgi:hypothetical protein